MVLPGQLIGIKNPHWKGGRKYDHGYIQILNREHPRADPHGYVYEHILVYEKAFNCCVLRSGHIHHIDKNITNNDINNLVLLRAGEHIRHHHLKDLSDRKCSECGDYTTYTNRKGWKNWKHSKITGGWLCGKCQTAEYRKLYPKYFLERKRRNIEHYRMLDNIRAARYRLRKAIFKWTP